MRRKTFHGFLAVCILLVVGAVYGQPDASSTHTVVRTDAKKVTVVVADDRPTTTATEQSLLTTTPTAVLTDPAKAVDAFVGEVGHLLDGMQQSVTRISSWQWLAAFALILGGLIFQRLIIWLLRGRFMKWAHRSKYALAEVFVQSLVVPVGWFPVVVGVVGAGLAIGFDPGSAQNPTWFRSLAITLLVVDISWACYNLVNVVTHLLHRLARRTDTPLDDQIVPLISKTMKVLVIVMGIVTLGNWVGGPFKGIIAGLGLGGLAVALAAKDTLANLFGYVVLFMDRPFTLGARVEIDGVYGDVEEVGLRSTRIRTRARTLVAIPNSVVANTQIENFSARPARRVEQIVGVTYETNAEQMERMVERIREILTNTDGIEQGTWCVGFEDFGGSSLDIRMRWYTYELLLPGHLKVRQAVNLAIMRAVKDEGLSIAFPTRTLYVRQDPDGVPVFGDGRDSD